MNYLPSLRKDAAKDSMLMMLMGMNNVTAFETKNGAPPNPMEPTPLCQPSSSSSLSASLPVTSSSSSWMMQANNGIPQDAVDPKAVDSLIAKEMAVLTPKEREQSYLDVHGISEAVEETPQLIEASQQAMELEILRQQDHDRKAYDLAAFMNRSYVEDAKLRLCFLRAEMFDPKKAALRYIQFFEAKLDLFGKDLLTMDITQDDFEQEDMDALYSGYAQFLPDRDCAGRAINLWISNSTHESSSTKAMLRREFYRAMIACQDEQTQKHGCVTICYFLGHGQGPKYRFDHRWTLSKLSEILPVRVAAIHLCYDNRIWMPVHAFMKASLNLFTRIRLRTHYGPHEDCLASLQGHGIPPGVLPVNAGGVLQNAEAYKTFLEQERKKERLSNPPRVRIMVPSPNDVLFGKGTPVQNHVGNKKLRRLVMDCQKSYEKAEKGTKILVAQEIVDIVLESSGRFLRPADNGMPSAFSEASSDDNTNGNNNNNNNNNSIANNGVTGYGCSWINVDNESARTKVSAAFRTLRWKAKK
ncbi:unnamed protein product [Cylindrotheca closterium]|uniref:DUF6824 domain-containing protein n=1 Tax=Cylindrotheca closterium TaxID=2856 RepID=A0AAD2CXC9_9STRA|nr:unnamed protein product [Cylindrotheca closterium]